MRAVTVVSKHCTEPAGLKTTATPTAKQHVLQGWCLQACHAAQPALQCVKTTSNRDRRCTLHKCFRISQSSSCKPAHRGLVTVTTGSPSTVSPLAVPGRERKHGRIARLCGSGKWGELQSAMTVHPVKAAGCQACLLTVRACPNRKLPGEMDLHQSATWHHAAVSGTQCCIRWYTDACNLQGG